jgi:AcrR family transcriptional regulator
LPETDKPIHPRKVEIVHAAVQCFLERGYHQTGVRDIAKQAGVSLGNLYNHFKSKEAVLAFIAEIEGAELSSFIILLSEPADPMTALEQFIEEYAAYALRPENAMLGVEILTEALRNPVIIEVFGKNQDLLIDALVSCLNAGKKLGVFAPCDNVRTVACMILDTLDGYGLRSLSKSSGNNADWQALSRFIIKGLRP